MPNYIEIDRRFVARSKYVLEELLASEISGKRFGWEKVLEQRFAVVVAPANSGKTTEMKQRAQLMRSRSQHAVFVPLRRVADRGSLDAALESREKAALRSWITARAESLTMFVDSLDEASAGHSDSIGHLIRVVADQLQHEDGHIRWVISTRPAVLTAEILQQLNDVLVPPLSLGRTRVDSGGEAADTLISEAPATESEKLHLFSMISLDFKQAQVYLQAKYPSLNAKLLLETARARGLSGFTTTPGGLDVLAHIDLVSRPPESLTEVFQRVVGAVRELQRQDTRFLDAGSPAAPHVTTAAQRIASASQVCQLPNVEIPEERLGVTDGVLSARLIASHLLTERQTTQLLNSQLFVDVGYHQVKMYPEELAPFLGAQRLAGLVQSPDQAQKLLDLFCWRAPTGEKGVYRNFLPLIGWLATLNPHCREEVLERDPQALAFFGDLRNPDMPLPAAYSALERSIRAVVERGDQLGRGHFTLTSENFWQAGRTAVLPLIERLFIECGHHSEARDALLSIATHSGSEVLRPLVLSEHGGDFGKVARNSGDLHYLLSVGHEEDLVSLADTLKREPDLRDSTKATLISHLAWRNLSGSEIGAIVNAHFHHGRGGFNIAYVLDADFLKEASDRDLYSLSRSVVLGLSRWTRTQDGPGVSAGERYSEVTVEVLAAAVRRGASQHCPRIAFMCLILQHKLRSLHLSSDARTALENALNESVEVRRKYLFLSAQRALKQSDDLWMTLFGYDSLCSVTPDDVAALEIPELTRLFAEMERATATRPSVPQVSTRTKLDDTTIPDAVKQELSSMVPEFRRGSAITGFIWVAQWLLRRSRASRHGEVDFHAFEVQAGSEVADAIREGLSKLWRTQDPVYTESEPRSTPYITIAGLQGLHLDCRDGEFLPPLSAEEVVRAIRYATFEINGYPKWFWPLVGKHPQIAAEELVRVSRAGAQGAVSREHANTLLASLQSAPASVRTRLAPVAWEYLQHLSTENEYDLERMLAVAVDSAPPGVDVTELAWERVENAFAGSGGLAPSIDAQASRLRSEALIWATKWMTHSPESFAGRLTKWRAEASSDADAFLFHFAARLGRDRRGELISLATHESGPVVLGALYEWAMEVIRPEDDNDHADGEAYTPDVRDNAEGFRDAVIPAIATARSQLAYTVLERLRTRASGRRAEYLHETQFRMREEQYARPPIHQEGYDDFERTLTTQVTGSTSFAMAVHTDLLAVKYDVEKGEYSLRRFFTEAHLARSKAAEDEEHAGLALEADFQRLLASELHHHAKGRYSVTVEPHTAEAKRRDVLCSTGDMFASIELKMSMRWTLEKYVEALEKQLVGQYMRHRGATIGFLVIVLQEEGRRWHNPATGEWIDFSQLIELLRGMALALEAQDRQRYLRVIDIDATSPPDFRAKAEPKKVVRSRRTEKVLHAELAALPYTHWFHAECGELPVRAGVYQVRGDGTPDDSPFCYWDGETWSCHGSTPDEAVNMRYMRAVFVVRAWRGLLVA